MAGIAWTIYETRSDLEGIFSFNVKRHCNPKSLSPEPGWLLSPHAQTVMFARLTLLHCRLSPSLTLPLFCLPSPKGRRAATTALLSRVSPPSLPPSLVSSTLSEAACASAVLAIARPLVRVRASDMPAGRRPNVRLARRGSVASCDTARANRG